MSIFSRFKKGLKASANATIDRAISPEKELELAISEFDEMRKTAIQELISYKSTAKQMEQDMDKYRKKAEVWDQRARDAVMAGDDELAKQALKEKRNALTEFEKIKRDRDEAAGYAIQLNNSRKEAETKLRILKLKKGTMAAQLARVRAGGSPLDTSNELWDRFEAAEDKIDAESIAADVHASMAEDEADAAQVAAAIDRLQPDAVDSDDPLVRLKAKMRAEKSTPALPSSTTKSDE